MKRTITFLLLLLLFMALIANSLYAGNWYYDNVKGKWVKDITPDLYKFNQTNTTAIRSNIYMYGGNSNPVGVTPGVNGHIAVTGGQIAASHYDNASVRQAFIIDNGVQTGTLRFAQSSANVTTTERAGFFLGYLTVNFYMPSNYTFTNYLISYSARIYNPVAQAISFLVYDVNGIQRGSTITTGTAGWNQIDFVEANTTDGRSYRFKYNIPNTSTLVTYMESPLIMLNSANEPTVRTINVNKQGNGTVTGIHTTVRDQDVQVFTLTPGQGEVLLSATYNGVSVSPVNNGNGTYSYTTPLLTQEGTFNVTYGYNNVASVGGNLSDMGLDDYQLSVSHIAVNSGEFIVNQSKTISKITLAAGAKLNINSGSTLTATNGITLESDANGTATMLQSGTLTGNVIAKQYLGTARNWYVSSPVISATSPATNVDYYYEYVEAGDNTDFVSQPGTSSLYWKGLSIGTTMAVGKGYIAKTSAGTTVQFTGTPNNGNITTAFNLTRNDAKGKGFNLVGNPYPSYIDWTDVAAANPNLDNTYYYRTKNSTNGYTFVTWNGAGSNYVVSNGSLPVNTTVTRYIPPTQAFWVRVKSGTSSTAMNFTNTMREHRDDNGNLMKAKRQDTRISVRLQLQNGTDTDELLIYQDEAASNSYDAFDSPKMMNNSSVLPDLYSKVGDERLVINGLNAIVDNMELPLGFSLNSGATLKLKATEMSNFTVGTRMYLLDKVESTQVELLPETEYSFKTTTATTNNESRFSLLFRAPNASTVIENAKNGNTQVFVNVANQITILAPEKASYSVYNAVGQKIENGILNTKCETINAKLNTGVYVVKVNNQSTRVIIK